MQNNNSNILLATILSIAVLISWTFFVEMPRVEKEQQMQEVASEALDKKPVIKNARPEIAKDSLATKKPVIELNQNREKLIMDSSDLRVKIENNNIIGSINLVGAKFDDLTLKNILNPLIKSKMWYYYRHQRARKDILVILAGLVLTLRLICPSQIRFGVLINLS